MDVRVRFTGRSDLVFMFSYPTYPIPRVGEYIFVHELLWIVKAVTYNFDCDAVDWLMSVTLVVEEYNTVDKLLGDLG